MTERYEITDKNISTAAKVISHGGLVVYPTETCYGLGTNALEPRSVRDVYRAKDRPREKKLTMIVGSLEQAERYGDISYTEKVLIDAFMPGPLTIITEKKDAIPDVTNDKFVFRIPGSETARKLALDADVPLIATSANITGQGPHYRIKDIEPSLMGHVDVALDGGTLEHRAPSTIVELREDELILHREGPVRREQLEAVLNDS